MKDSSSSQTRIFGMEPPQERPDASESYVAAGWLAAALLMIPLHVLYLVYAREGDFSSLLVWPVPLYTAAWAAMINETPLLALMLGLELVLLSLAAAGLLPLGASVSNATALVLAHLLLSREGRRGREEIASAEEEVRRALHRLAKYDSLARLGEEQRKALKEAGRQLSSRYGFTRDLLCAAFSGGDREEAVAAWGKVLKKYGYSCGMILEYDPQKATWSVLSHWGCDGLEMEMAEALAGEGGRNLDRFVEGGQNLLSLDTSKPSLVMPSRLDPLRTFDRRLHHLIAVPREDSPHPFVIAAATGKDEDNPRILTRGLCDSLVHVTADIASLKAPLYYL